MTDLKLIRVLLSILDIGGPGLVSPVGRRIIRKGRRRLKLASGRWFGDDVVFVIELSGE